MDLSLKGKTAVVCGSSQGIGLAIAKELAELGATCILLARNEEKLKVALQQLNTANRQQHTHYAIDFNDREKTRKLIREIISKQTVHILVNNSGGPKAGPIVQATEDQFMQAFQQHLIVNHILTTSVIEGMKKEGYGRIINIISTSVKIPINNLGVSNTIRWAVASWAKTMANELGQYGITVNNILPGYTLTDRLESLVQHNSKAQNISEEALMEQMKEDIPSKRFGKPEEVAAMAVFLTTPAAAYVNGTSIAVDGGKTGAM
jgi:3-oxoacyl-[acyl-carrier protein] reductase